MILSITEFAEKFPQTESELDQAIAEYDRLARVAEARRAEGVRKDKVYEDRMLRLQARHDAFWEVQAIIGGERLA